MSGEPSTAVAYLELKHEIDALEQRLAEAKAKLAAMGYGRVPNSAAVIAALGRKYEDEQTKKDFYNENRRVKRAAAKKAAPHELPASLTSEVPATPARLRELWHGDEVTTPTEEHYLIHRHTSLWADLVPNTANQYLTNAKRILNMTLPAGAEKIPNKLTDPLVYADRLLAIPGYDIWATMTEMSDPAKHSLSTRNNFAKGLLGVLTEWMRANATSTKGWATVALWATIVHYYNNKTRLQVFENFTKQIQSLKAAENTVANWNEWMHKAAVFVDANRKPGCTFDQRRDAMLIACYSLIPPIRNNWATVEVGTKPPSATQRRNVIVFEPAVEKGTLGKITTYWGDFKNRKSFAGQLPLKIPVTNPTLIKRMHEYRKSLKSKWFLPKEGWSSDTHFSEGELGRHLGDLTMKIVKKRFTSTRMRASFITTWHKENDVSNLAKLHEVMKALHQTSVEVHLAYSKHLLRGGATANFDSEDDD